MYRSPAVRIDGLVVVAVGLILFMLFNVIRDVGGVGKDLAFGSAMPVSTPDVSISILNPPDPSEVGFLSADESMPADAETAQESGEEEDQDGGDGDPIAFAAPYKEYRITQGPHGFSYGHMAIDLAAGKGVKIKSPINGIVTGLYIDEYGNPTLEIENERYFVTLLHGDYTVQEGDRVEIGQNVGTESNKGYTTDMRGVPCYGREGCGYHSHLNVYDKQAGSNVNPLDLIQP